MDFKKIKNDRNYFWTNHAKFKLRQYGLSPAAIKKILKNPDRKENGVAPKTAAAMARRDTRKMKKEMWVMYQKNIKNQISRIKMAKKNAKLENYKNISNSRVKIISAWIYPGVSPTGENIYIPEDALAALAESSDETEK